jgi:hypothetical protein
MEIEVDITQPIKNKRLKVINQDYWQIFGAFLFIISAAMIILLGLFFLFQFFTETRKSLLIFIIFTPFLIIGITAIHSLLFDNCLVQMQGDAYDKNYHTIRSILQIRYQIALPPNPVPLLSIYKDSTFWKFGVRVIVLFHDADVYMNISRFNQKGVKSVFHLWLDNLKIRSINREFQRKLEAT